jgi:DNA-binding response OmpR family regulator
MSGDSVKILLIEDEDDLRDALSEDLGSQGFQVKALGHGNNAVQVLNEYAPDLLILDQVLPGKSGQEILVEVRAQVKFAEMPILILTGLTAEEQIVLALNRGADDYMTKPFSTKELTARISALVRRAKMQHKSQLQQMVIKELVVDLSTHKVTLSGQPVPLTLTEFKILCELIRQTGNVLTRDRLRERALGNLNVSDRTIDVHMASLRKKLEGMGTEIETVRGVGYRMAV